MTYYGSNFNSGAASPLPGFATYCATAGFVGFVQNASGVANTDSTGLSIALSSKAPGGDDQFVQVTLQNNVGTSTGILLRATHTAPGTPTSTAINGYNIRHTATELALQRLDGTSPAVTLGTPVTVNRAAGEVIRATAVGSVISVYLNDLTTPVITYDTTPDATKYLGGTTGMRSTGVTGVAYDSFDSGLVPTDVSKIGTYATDLGSVVETINNPPASGVPQFKGLTYGPSGRLILPGKALHTFRSQFFGPAGAYTPPSWMSFPDGTATLTDPTASSPSRLALDTAASVGAKATVALTPQFKLGAYAAIRIDVEGFNFSVNSPAAKLRLGVLGANSSGAGMAQFDTAGAVFLFSQDENQRTRGVGSTMGTFATQRRQMSVIILPWAKQVFLLEDDEMQVWRDGSATWTDGMVTAALQIEATSTTALSARVGQFAVTLYA